MITEKLLKHFWNDFSVKDLGTLSYFLENEVCHTSNGLILTPHKYIQDLWSKTNMLISKAVPMSMFPSEKLLLDGGEKLSPEGTTCYRSVVGTLQYFSLTCPGISFYANKVC